MAILYFHFHASLVLKLVFLSWVVIVCTASKRHQSVISRVESDFYRLLQLSNYIKPLLSTLICEGVFFSAILYFLPFYSSHMVVTEKWRILVNELLGFCFCFCAEALHPLVYEASTRTKLSFYVRAKFEYYFIEKLNKNSNCFEALNISIALSSNTVVL